MVWGFRVQQAIGGFGHPANEGMETVGVLVSFSLFSCVFLFQLFTMVLRKNPLSLFLFEFAWVFNVWIGKASSSFSNLYWHTLFAFDK